MIEPINCRCGNRVGEFDTQTGGIRAFLPAIVFGAYLPCSECNSVYRFDGGKTVRRRKNREKRLNFPKTDKSPSFGEKLLAGLEKFKPALQG